MNRDAAVRLVNAWIEDYRIYLKDGGGSAGVHATAKEALISRISDAFQARPTPPPLPTKVPRKKKAPADG